MAFKPRLTAPVSTNANDKKYYFTPNTFWPTYKMPNCTCYAWSRWHEILETEPDLPFRNAGEWFGYNKDNGIYPYGTVPKLGAVICWSKDGGAGHVAVVEEIHEDGSITTSDSGWQSDFWWLSHRQPPNYNKSSSYHFQGFIYNPACENLNSVHSEFLAFVASKVNNSDTSWVRAALDTSCKLAPPGVAFVLACAKSVKGLDKVIYNRISIHDLVNAGVTVKSGDWVPGSDRKPEPGDLVVFRDGGSTWVDNLLGEYSGDRIGVVTDVSDSIQVVYGDNQGVSGVQIKQSSYSITNKSIHGYYRPKWAALDASSTNTLGYPWSSASLYDTKNTKEDATLREIGYVNSEGEPSISTTDIRLSVINYTGVLSSMFSFVSDMYNILGGGGNNAIISNGVYTSPNLDNLDAIPREIVNSLSAKGLSIAACIGIVANIEAECSFRINNYGIDSNGKHGGGMCAWNGTSFDLMVSCVGPDWATNLLGQCDFLYDYMSKPSPYLGENWFKHVLKLWYGYEGDMVTALNSLPNTEAGARDAAALFMLVYENPQKRDTTDRRNIASKHWNKLVIQQQAVTR